MNLKNILALIAAIWSLAMSAQELSMAQAIEMALQNSAEIKVASFDLEAQKNKGISAWLDLGPRLSATYNQAYFDGKLTMPLNNTPITMRDDITKNGSLVLTQPVSGLFALMQKGRAENRQTELKETEYRLTKAQIAFKTAERYLRAQQSEKMWQISQSRIYAAKAQSLDGGALLRAERIHKGDFLKLELALSEAHAAEAKAKATRDIALFALMQLIGADHSDLSLPPLRADEIELRPLPSLDESLSLAAAKRLELKKARQGLELASIARTATFAKFFPSVNFFAQIDRNFGEPSFGGAKNTKMIGINLSWEFFNSGAHLFQVKEASQNIFKAQYQNDLVQNLVRLDVMQALASLKAAEEGLAFSKKALEQAEEAYRIEKLQFSLGKSKSSATSLVLAQTALTAAEGNVVSVLSELKIQQLKLQEALGEERPRL